MMASDSGAADHTLAVAGLAVAIPGLAQTCLHVLRATILQCQSLANAPDEIQDLLLRIDVASERIDASLQILKDAAPAMNFRLQSLLSRLLSRLQSVLVELQTRTGQTALATNTIASEGRLRQLLSKNSIEGSLDHLQRWQMDFDGLILSLAMSGRLVSIQGGPGIAVRLADAVQRADSFRNAFLGNLSVAASQSLGAILPEAKNECPIKYSKAFLPGPQDRSQFRVIVEYRSVDSATPYDAVPRLAQMLHAADPNMMALLRCNAYHGNRLSYEIPTGLKQEPKTLRQLLLEDDGQPKHSLDERLGLLTQLASALHFVHVAGNVHKQVRPDNILTFQKTTPFTSSASHDKTLGRCFLVGFDLSRGTGNRSERHGPSEVEKNIYLPLDRQGSQVHARNFSQWDDVYSFGVVALELALWNSFVTLRKSKTSAESFELSSSLGLKGLNATDLYNRFCKLAVREVPTVLGQTFAVMVFDCLTCLKPVNDSPLKQKLRGDAERPGAGAEYILQELLTLSL